MARSVDTCTSTAASGLIASGTVARLECNDLVDQRARHGQEDRSGPARAWHASSRAAVAAVRLADALFERARPSIARRRPDACRFVPVRRPSPVNRQFVAEAVPFRPRSFVYPIAIMASLPSNDHLTLQPANEPQQVTIANAVRTRARQLFEPSAQLPIPFVARPTTSCRRRL